MDIFLGLLVLSGLFALFQLLLPGKSGRGIGIAQWLSWIALATALVAFLGSGRAGETFDRITGNFVDRPSPSPPISPTISPTISPIPIESSPTTPPLTNPPPTPAPDSPNSLVAIEGWYQVPQTIEGLLPSPTPIPSPSPTPIPNPFPSPTPTPQPFPTPNPIPPPIPSPSPSPNPIPPPIPPSPSPQPPINGLW